VAEDTPSIATTPSTATTASAPPPAADAGSSGETTPSPAQSGETGKKPTLLDAVLKVVPADTEGDVLADKATDAPASPAIVSGEQASQGTEGEDDNPTEADTADMKPRMAKKFRTLLNQRSELQRQVADLQQLQPVAEIGGQLANFAQENDLSSDDVVRAVSLAAAVRRGDWQGFYQQVGPFVRRAQEYLGLVLPDDLGQRVQQGHMTEAAAREFARTRFDAARAEAIAGQRETEVQSSRVQHVQADVQRAVTSFETQLASRDPDYRAKADAIRRTTQAILHERGGRISTVQEALDIVQEAHAEVTAQYRRLLPPPRPTNPLPNGNSQQPSARAAPKTLMEAALQGLENSRRERA
jgi:ElaB/YqjD/DUF883 family membrane-anchored ribosome-binding protein